MSNKIQDATRNATDNATYIATRNATDNATWNATYDAIRNATDNATWNLDNYIKNEIHHSLNKL